MVGGMGVSAERVTSASDALRAPHIFKPNRTTRSADAKLVEVIPAFTPPKFISLKFLSLDAFGSGDLVQDRSGLLAVLYELLEQWRGYAVGFDLDPQRAAFQMDEEVRQIPVASREREAFRLVVPTHPKCFKEHAPSCLEPRAEAATAIECL